MQSNLSTYKNRGNFYLSSEKSDLKACKRVYYILDAQGNTMAVYERAVNASNQSVTFEQTEKHLFGSSRLGVMNVKVPMLGSQNTSYSMINKKHIIGQRNYELSNHLGNVLSVISDKPVPHTTNGTTHDYYMADILQSSDYSAFGVTLSGRNFVKANAKESRRGFNGMEEDDEVKGDGNSYDFGARMLDPRLGRWLSIDPLSGKYPAYTPYSFVNNMPIVAIDPDGKDIIILIAEEGAQGMGHMAMIIQDRNGNWYYFTQGAQLLPEDNLIDMLSGVQGGISFVNLNTKDATTAVNQAKKDIGNKPYTGQITITTSKDMDGKIFDKANEVVNNTNSGKEDYNILFNNCVDACQESIQAAVNLPFDFDPRPNNYFRKLGRKLGGIQKSINREIKKETKKANTAAERILKKQDKEKKKAEKLTAKEEKKTEKSKKNDKN